MRPQKLTQTEMLQRCAMVFKQHGYYATSMEMLAQACGLTKAAFYYHYKNKEALLLDIVKFIRQYAFVKIFSLCNQVHDAVQCYQQLHQTASQFFSQGICGCFMAIIALDVKDQLPEVMAEIQQFFRDWQVAMQHLYLCKYDAIDAYLYAKEAIADYEGAILMTRITGDEFYLAQVQKRILMRLA